MKLYATTTSERASKGQGGNEYLDIDILVRRKSKEGKPIDDYLARLTVREADYLGAEIYGLYNGDDELLAYLPVNLLTKGEKQKGKKICSEIGCLEPQSDRGGGLCNYHDKSL